MFGNGDLLAGLLVELFIVEGDTDPMNVNGGENAGGWWREVRNREADGIAASDLV